jgi:ferritin-like metal-binding protein YciE
MNQENLQELIVDQIRDLYDAEKQIVRALPKLAKAAESRELAAALQSHLEETQTQVSRLEEVFQNLRVAAKGKPCKGMKGLLEEGSEILQKEDKGALRDLAIIAACQKVEHYEMSAYGTTRTLAEHLEKQDVVDLLEQTEAEEKNADEKLTEVATSLYETADESADQSEEEVAMAAGSSRRAPVKSARRKAAR